MARRKPNPAARLTPPVAAPAPKATPGLSMPKAQYDAVATEAKKKRRQARVETAHETGKDSRQLSPMSRLAAIALVRDGCRNFSACRSMLHQIGLNVIGTSYQLRLKMKQDRKDPNDPVVQAQNWFNRRFAKRCDLRSDIHLCDWNRLAVQSVARDGDLGMFFDRDLMQTGRLAAWESDQICDPDTLPAGVHGSRDGVLLDMLGREIGYFVHSGHGSASVPLANGFVMRRDPLDDDQNMFRLLRMPWRHNQARGIPDMLTVISDLLDCYEMRAKELQSAKVAASIAGVVKKKDPVPNAYTGDLRLDPNNPTTGDAPAVPDQVQYERFESLVGGYLEYMEKDDSFELLTSNRPNVNGIPFVESIVRSAGTACGMARCYSTMEAQTSYTAFRGEMIMTWVMFRYWQKWAERGIRDWQAIRALRFAMAIGEIPQLPEGWEFAMAWNHPKMPSVDPLKDQETFLAALKNGTTTIESEVGPGYGEIFEQLGDELDDLRAKNIPHAMFETKAGAPTPNQTKTPDGDTAANDEDEDNV